MQIAAEAAQVAYDAQKVPHEGPRVLHEPLQIISEAATVPRKVVLIRSEAQQTAGRPNAVFEFGEGLRLDGALFATVAIGSLAYATSLAASIEDLLRSAAELGR